jgi:allantoinase
VRLASAPPRRSGACVIADYPIRYDYTAILSRSIYDWPGGARLAFYIALNVEHFALGRGRGAHIAPPEQAVSLSIYSWRDYGNRVGFWRLLELFDEFDLPIEAQVNSAIYGACPDIPDALVARGEEILGHGITNSDDQGALDEAAEAAMIAQASGVITAHQGSAPAGWMSPWISQMPRTPDLLREVGYRYMMD